ncbi:histidine phosphatase family protein [Microbacterium profundi]|uniref:histidine phosphatase family protein n=1 Tax=Microbacterium profundi TaxID=450380 RepID=UPI0027DFCB0B|nr:histidine phosphatase family protein [Microbacterium profundi]MCE7480633.1 histidine phosphatase family protein [Microbacterium profundi]
MTFITLVRHGQTDWNLDRRIQGSTDIPLNETGRGHARAAAALLAGTTHHAIYASPLVRARETAQIIAGAIGLAQPELVSDLREREFGEAEGMLVADYIDRYGDWHADVPKAENFDQVAERALAALDVISLASRRRSAPTAESVIVVAHGGVIRALLDHASGGTMPPAGAPLANGSVHRFEAAPGILRLLETVTV